MSWTARLSLAAVLVCAPGAASVLAQQSPSTIVIVTGQQAPMPIPTLIEGVQNTLANQEIADQLFLPLAAVGPGLVTAGDRGFVPLLAKSWKRADSLTLVFELDPRARWHDGAPVSARDVVFTFARARDSTITPRLASLLRRIAGVTAQGDHQVTFRFKEVYAEQLYDTSFYVAILPAHLLARLPPRGDAWAGFARQPVGNGPYRWVRRVEGQYIELAANRDFFLGRPGIDRVIVRVAGSPDARINMVLSGDADAMDNIPPPTTNLARVEASPHLRVVPVPSNTLGFLLFNQRDPAHRDRPHPILADRDVRRALILALDRDLLVRAVLSRNGIVPYGPVSAQLWIRHGAPSPAKQDLTTARQLLAGRGWIDRNQDGVRENLEGTRLSLRLTVSTSSTTRMQMSAIIQEQLRQVGVDIQLVRVEPAVWQERRAAGNFDIDFSNTNQDPSPTGLVFSWSCDGQGNMGRYCDRGADSLLFRAIASPKADRGLWHEFMRRVEEAAPAAFLYTQTYLYAVNRRFHDVNIRPVSSWSALWRWPAPRS